jgi:hypothetical protein
MNLNARRFQFPRSRFRPLAPSLCEPPRFAVLALAGCVALGVLPIASAAESQSQASAAGVPAKEEARTAPAPDKSPSSRRLEEIEAQLAELATEVAQARAGKRRLPLARIPEIEKRLAALSADLERLRAGEAVADAEKWLGGSPSAASSASPGENSGPRLSIGGYGEAIYQNFESRADDGSPASQEDSLDLLRAVLYFGYTFEHGIHLSSEIEYEHATTGEGTEERGEVTVESATLELPLDRHTQVRAGQMIVPMGIVNRWHEPPQFLGARRPDVEQLIIPSTWSEIGAGLYGEAGPVSWSAQILASLDASRFSAEGIREGRSSGSQSKARDLALAARADWTPLPDLCIGGSFFGGDAGQGLEDTSGRKIGARTTLYELHAGWGSRGWQARALFAQGRVADVARLNGTLGLTGTESIG